LLSLGAIQALEAGSNWIDVPNANLVNALALQLTNSSAFFGLVYP
jgi:hypothetical protein